MTNTAGSGQMIDNMNDFSRLTLGDELYHIVNSADVGRHVIFDLDL